MTLGTDDELIVEADIPEVDVVRVEETQPVEVTLTALGDIVLAGEVIEIQRVGQRDESVRFGGAAPGAEFLARIRLLDPPPSVRPLDERPGPDRDRSARGRARGPDRGAAPAVPGGGRGDAGHRGLRHRQRNGCLRKHDAARGRRRRRGR